MTDTSYGIKAGYQHGAVNLTIEKDAGEYFTPSRIKAFRNNQVHPYLEAAKLMRRHGLKSVLDVGCGTGYKLVHHLEPLAERSAGIDQPTAIDLVKRINPATVTRLVVMDLEHPEPTDLGLFDLVLSVDVIEHLTDPDQLLRVIADHCHSDTYVLISTPERDVRRGPECMKPRKHHVREWNRAELKRYLESRGFEVIAQPLLPGFRVGWSPSFLRERLRLVRKRIPYRHNQLAVCRVLSRERT